MAIRNRLNRRIGGRFERFDPNAIDGDMDGTVQEGTAFERPSTPRNMPQKLPTSRRISGSMARTRINAERDKKIVELYKDTNLTIPQIAEQMGTNRDVVTGVLRQARKRGEITEKRSGGARIGLGETSETIKRNQQIIDLYKNTDLTIAQIAEQTGTNKDVVNSTLRQARLRGELTEKRPGGARVGLGETSATIERNKQIIDLYKNSNLTIPQIAEQTGTSRDTVTGTLRQARLRGELTEKRRSGPRKRGNISGSMAKRRGGKNRPEVKPQRQDEALAAVSGSEPIHRTWARLANAQGWTVEKRGTGHIAYIPPDKSIPAVIVGSTGLRGRGDKNAEAKLRRAGLDIPRKGESRQVESSFRLEAVEVKLSAELRAEALDYAAKTYKDKNRLKLDDMAGMLGIDDEELKNKLKDAVNDKYPGYFPDSNTDENDGLTRRQRRRGMGRDGLSGSMGRKEQVEIVGEQLVKEAESAGVDLSKTLDESDIDTDVSWSSNSWSFGKTKVQEAADAIIVRTNDDGEQEVLMIRRKTPPFTDGLTLPGGLLDEGETLEQTADREMEEEVGINASSAKSKRYLGEIKARDWDPRFVEGVRVGGARYDVPADTRVTAASDARDAVWVPVKELAAGKHRIGFGHAGWLALAFESDPEIARRFDILARASRHRNQRIIKRVNEKRKDAGEKLFSGLGSPNKHYIPEGAGPLGMRRVNNLGLDLATVVTRNPGFFDKRTEEMFIHRATHSSAESAKKFGMTEREFDDKLREATIKLETKIRRDVAKKMDEKGRKKGIKGSIATRIVGTSALAARARREQGLNLKQQQAVQEQTENMHSAFRTGEIYDIPIHAAIDDQRRELLDSIRITTAKSGLPMIVAKPHPLINPHLPIEREWQTIELPPRDAVAKFVKELLANQGDGEEDLSGLNKFYDYFADIIEKLRVDGGQVPILEYTRDIYRGGYTSYVQEYHLSLQDPVRASALLESFDLGVHDLFGHFGTGRAYDRHGEWANYLAMQDVIEHVDLGLTPEQKEGLHKFWLREYGTLQILKRGDFGDLPIEDDGRLVGPIAKYTGKMEDLLKLLDAGENGLGGARLSRSISGSISGKKIKDVPLSRLKKIAVDDVENKLSISRNRKVSKNQIAGSMGVFDDDADLGEYIDFLKKKMGKQAWDGEDGEKVRKITDKIFNIDISEDERDRLIDDLLDIEIAYMGDIYDDDDDLIDEFDYELDALGESDKDWKEYLDYLKRTDPDEYEFWKDYTPTGDGESVDKQPTLWDEPWDRPTSTMPKKDAKSKRRIFGWRRKKDTPSKYINRTKFYGHEKMREKQREQLEMFKAWKEKSDWKGLHNAHYDWWTFPIDRGSAAYGDGYNVAGKNIDALKNDREYINNLRQLVSIYAEAMGWDLDNAKWFDTLDWDKGQDPYKQAYGARLYKIARSLQIFGMNDEFNSFYEMVQSLRTDDKTRRIIGKSNYWDNPDVPFNRATPGSRRAERKLREQFGAPKSDDKNKKRNISGSISSPPNRGGSSRGRRNIYSDTDKQMRFLWEIDVDNWYIFIDDINEYAEKVKSRDIKISTPEYHDLMKALSIINSLEAVPTDDNGISINMSNEEVKRIRLLLKTMTELPNFFNIAEIYNALPTKQKPRTIEVGGPSV